MPPRELTFWRLMYESAACADWVLSLNVEDVDMARDRGRVTRDGAVRWVRWQDVTTRRLAELAEGRPRGPLFLADRRPAPARMPAAHLGGYVRPRTPPEMTGESQATA
ncbi:hypothetical protein E1293_16555 [Actinomadura darangshiensis]|uniref:Uncharacterized protein n=1 Tax=Actinomadura darangshiensis TaxID=705336 RepID=A0A4R5BCN5_9ACTN|nr:hypothetical protein [Actinomadura darangshiensis]TDD82520.1 hypothetical protein E1293_16555 [Actinomadura darangshiensis]